MGVLAGLCRSLLFSWDSPSSLHPWLCFHCVSTSPCCFGVGVGPRCLLWLADFPLLSRLVQLFLFIFGHIMSESIIRDMWLSSRLIQDSDKSQAWKIQPLLVAAPSRELGASGGTGRQQFPREERKLNFKKKRKSIGNAQLQYSGSCSELSHALTPGRLTAL